MTRPFVPFADVTMFAALDPDGETYRKCRLTIVGKPADVVLYSLDVDGTRWRVVDRLTYASVDEHPDGTFTVIGISSELIDIVGVVPSEATVRWEVSPRRCSGCR